MDNLKIHDLSKAYLGDAVFSMYVRHWILKNHPEIRVNDAHQLGTKFEKASSQSKALLYLQESGVLSAEEFDVARKARNKTSQTRAKNASMKEYRNATGIEALVAVLFLDGKHDRLDEIFEIIMRGEYL